MSTGEHSQGGSPQPAPRKPDRAGAKAEAITSRITITRTCGACTNSRIRGLSAVSALDFRVCEGNARISRILRGIHSSPPIMARFRGKNVRSPLRECNPLWELLPPKVPNVG